MKKNRVIRWLMLERFMIIAASFKYCFLGLSLMSYSSYADDSFSIRFLEKAPYYTVELNSSRQMSEQEGLAIIEQAAIKKCGKESALLGKYRFVGDEIIDKKTKLKTQSMRMTQKLLCGEAPPSVVQKPTKKLTADKKRALEQQINELTNKYFSNIEKKQFKDSYNLLSDYLRNRGNFSQWKNSQQKQANMGALLKADNWRLTTYVDSPGAPKKGIYIAVDFERQYVPSALMCGYFVWHFVNKEPKITRQEIGIIDSNVLERINKSDLAMLKKKMKCKP